MDRNNKDIKYFIGPEVEHTPAFSKKTLFVVRKQQIAQIEEIAREYKVTHIFLGANHSFNTESNDTYWDVTITNLLDKGFWVTLCYQAHEHEIVLKMLNKGIWQSRLFIPLLGVRIPNIQNSSPNLTIKIDDTNFRETNDGVWCIHHHEITDSNRFTPWQDYDTDVEVYPTSNIVNAAPSTAAPKTVVVEQAINKSELSDETPEIKESDSIKNDGSLGLDENPATSLKPEIDTESASSLSIPDVVDVSNAAEAYAEGATSDPLGEEASKKPKSKKK